MQERPTSRPVSLFIPARVKPQDKPLDKVASVPNNTYNVIVVTETIKTTISIPFEEKFAVETVLSAMVNVLASREGFAEWTSERLNLRDLTTDTIITNDEQLRKAGVCSLTLNPEGDVPRMLQLLRSTDANDIKKTLFVLARRVAKEPIYGQLIAKNGMDLIQEIVLKSDGNTLAYALQVLDGVLKHVKVPMPQTLVTTICNIILLEGMANIIRSATSVLAKCLRFTSEWLPMVAHQRIVAILANRLADTDQGIQESSLNLINTLLEQSKDIEPIANHLVRLSVPQLVAKLQQRKGTAQPDEFDLDLLEFQRLWAMHLAGKNAKSLDFLRNSGHVKMRNDVLSTGKVTIPDVSELALENLHSFAIAHNQFMDQQMAERCVEVTHLLVFYWHFEEEPVHFEPLLFHFEQVHSILVEACHRLSLTTSRSLQHTVALVRTQFSQVCKDFRTSDLISELKQRMLDINLEQVEKLYASTLDQGDKLQRLPVVRRLRDELRVENDRILKRCRIKTLKRGDWFLLQDAKAKGDYMRFAIVSQGQLCWDDVESNQTNPALSKKMDLQGCKVEWKRGVENGLTVSAHGQSLDLICTDGHEALEWYDGLILLTQQNPRLASSTEALLERLTTIALHISLLDATTHQLELK
jgi:hypothetical protein